MKKSSFTRAPISLLFSLPDPPMLVEDFLPHYTITGLSSDPNVGKTWFALELAGSVLTGRKFLGKFQAHSGAVLFVEQDSSIYDCARQIRKLFGAEYREWCEREKTGEENPFHTCLHTLIQPGLRLGDINSVQQLVDYANSVSHSPKPQPIMSEKYDEAGNIVEFSTDFEFQSEKGVSLIVIDSQRSTTEGIPENDSATMGVVYSNLRYLSDSTNSTVLVLHHNSHSSEFAQERWRGSSAQWGALDNWFQLRRVRSPGGRYTSRIMCVTKKVRGLRGDNFTYIQEVDQTKGSLIFEKYVTEEIAEGEKPKVRSEGWEDLERFIITFLTPAISPLSVKEISKGVQAKMGPLGVQKQFLTKLKHKLNELVDLGKIMYTPSCSGYSIKSASKENNS